MIKGFRQALAPLLRRLGTGLDVPTGDIDREQGVPLSSHEAGAECLSVRSLASWLMRLRAVSGVSISMWLPNWRS